jgi:hypothetical protein
MDEARVLFQQAMRESESLLNRLRRRAYSEMPSYRRGTELLAEANPATFTSFTRRLRSEGLKPAKLLNEVDDPATIVESVISRRAELVNKFTDAAVDLDRSDGRLLVFWPEETLFSDGAAEYSSCGYFDAENTPPWDTWIAFSQGALLSWVPGELVELAGKGIEANPEQCIAWYDVRAQRCR